MVHVPARLTMLSLVAASLVVPAAEAGGPIFGDGFEWGNSVGWSRTIAPCDGGLAVADPDPLSGAAAIEFCPQSPGSPGLISAEYVTVDGEPLSGFSFGMLGVGLLDGFGPNVATTGARLLALSTGAGRAPGDPGYQSPAGYSKGMVHSFPPGFPYSHPLCGGVLGNEPHDSAGLALTLEAPLNAASLSFRWKFYSWDWPLFTCSAYTDTAAVIMDPPPPGTDPINRNILLDPQGHAPMSASSSAITVCEGDPDCVDGPAELLATGFEGHGATVWLRTAVPVEPGGQLTLLFTIWDSGDEVSDSILLVDDFRWSADPP